MYLNCDRTGERIEQKIEQRESAGAQDRQRCQWHLEKDLGTCAQVLLNHLL